MNMDWEGWLKINYKVLGSSKAYKCTNYDIQVGEGLTHWTLCVNISDRNQEGYKFFVGIKGQNNPNSNFIKEFKEKLAKSFTINSSNTNSIFTVII